MSATISRPTPIKIIFAYLCLLLLVTPSAAGALDPLCDSIKKLSGCKSLIKIPTAAIKTCDTPFFKVDQCKTKYRGRYPCGVSWKGVKWCDGWTCVPGTVETTIKVPCGLTIGSKSIKSCDMAQAFMPGVNLPELLRVGAGTCKCFPSILSLLDLDTVKAILSSPDLSEGSAEILGKFGVAQQCIIDEGFNVQDNKAGLSTQGGALFKDKNIQIFTAAEIDLARYIAFATALSPCFVSTCAEPAIRGFFTDYLTDSEEMMSKQLIGFLTPWQKSFEGIKASFDTLGNNLGDIGGQFSSIKESTEKIRADFCKNITSCAETTVGKLKTKVDSTITSSEAFIALKTEISEAVTDMEQLAKVATTAIELFESFTDLGIEGIVKQVFAGKLRSVKELAEILKASQQLPKIFEDLQKTLPNVQTYVKKLQDSVPEFIKSIDDVVADSWFEDAQGDNQAAANAKEAVQQIQSLFKNNITTQASSIFDGVSSMVTSFQSILTGAPNIEVRVASYQRWSTGKFVMPCLTTSQISLKLGGFSTKVDYPKFYRCEKSYRVPFPNHHIPFVKVTLGSGGSKRRGTGKRQVEVDEMTEVNSVEPPTVTETVWTYIDEVADADYQAATATPDAYNPDAEEVTVAGGNAQFTTPADLFTKKEEVPQPTASAGDPNVVYLETTDGNGVAITTSTTLTNGSTLEVSSTEVLETVTTDLGGANFTTPAGFQEGTLAVITPTAGVTSTRAIERLAETATQSAKGFGTVLEPSVRLLILAFVPMLFL